MRVIDVQFCRVDNSAQREGYLNGVTVGIVIVAFIIVAGEYLDQIGFYSNISIKPLANIF